MHCLRYILFFCFTFISLIIEAQTWNLFNPGNTSIYDFNQGSYWEVVEGPQRALKLDTLSYDSLNGNYYFENFRTIIPFSNAFPDSVYSSFYYAASKTGYFGKNIIFSPQLKQWSLVNICNDTLTFLVTQTNSWKAFENDTLILKIEKGNYRSETIFNTTDSVCDLTFKTYNSFNQPITNNLSNVVLRLSKSYGLLDVMDFTTFPKNINFFSLSGYNEKGVFYVSHRDAFTFEPGDLRVIRQYHACYGNKSVNRYKYIKTLAVLDSTADYITYLDSVYQYADTTVRYSSIPVWIYSATVDTNRYYINALGSDHLPYEVKDYFLNPNAIPLSVSLYGINDSLQLNYKFIQTSPEYRFSPPYNIPFIGVSQSICGSDGGTYYYKNGGGPYYFSNFSIACVDDEQLIYLRNSSGEYGRYLQPSIILNTGNVRSDHLTLHYGNQQLILTNISLEAGNYNITDLNGKLVKQGRVEKIIDCNSLKTGLYFFNLITKNEKVITEKFIVE